MEGRNINGLNRQGSNLWRSFRNGDFEEEDVWDILHKSKAKPNSNSSKSQLLSAESFCSIYESSQSQSSSFSAQHFPSAARMIPRAASGGGGGGGDALQVQSSAPLPIPNWFFNNTEAKNYPRKKITSSDDDGDDDDDDYDDDDDDDGKMVPPHELIAKRLAKSQISSFSVLEGVGRKLKGRDLSKVRTAVLTKTGFLESL